MMELPEQRMAARGRDFVDTKLLGEKQNAKAFRGAAYSVGIAVGFLLISSFMGFGEADDRMKQMIDLVRTMAFWTLGYAFIVIFSYIKIRPHMKYVLFMLNWFLVPTFAIWFILRVADIYSTEGSGLLP